MNTSSGLYGTVRPALVTASDVDIYYFYRPTRGTSSPDYTGFKKVGDPALWFSPAAGEDNTTIVGLYNLNLPLTIFNQKGIYTVYIRPKEIETKISDVSVLQNYPDVKGVVFSTTNLGGIVDLTGYRIEYLDDSKVPLDIARLITSCNNCSPVRVAVTDAYPNTIRYSLSANDTSSQLVFCTVTPSLANASKTNSLPFIGVPGGNVKIVNTKFDPILFEVEMVEHDADTISTILEGDQIRDLDHQIITTYNENKEIYKQQEYYTLKSSNGTPLYDVKINKTAIDRTQSYDNIIE